MEKPQELVNLGFTPGATRSGWFTTRGARFTAFHWKELQQRREPFSGVFAWSANRFNLSTGGEARYAEGLYVSGEFFSVLGVQPALGRVMQRGDDAMGAPRTAK